MTTKLGVICALKAEAKTITRQSLRGKRMQAIAVKPNLFLCISGMASNNAQQAAQTLIDAGVDALVSWGVAGGLNPAVDVATLMLPKWVRHQSGETYSLHTALRESLYTQLNQHVHCSELELVHSDTVVSTPQAKAALFASTNAGAVDMESFAIAQIANRYKIPCIAVRSIVDAAQANVPSAMSSAKYVQHATIDRHAISAFLCQPLNLWHLCKLGRNFSLAKKPLREAAKYLKKER